MPFKNAIQLLESKNIYVFLLPLFFVWHGFTSHYDSVPVFDAVWLALQYTVVSFIIAALCWLLYRDFAKAGLATLFIMAFYFFFGEMLDFVKALFPQMNIRYRFTLPFSYFLFLVLFVWLWKRKKSLTKIILYLNVLLPVLILYDAGRLIVKIPTVREKKVFHPAAEGLTICDSCSKPDIFLIIPDQYAGSAALQEVFQFDNSAFENELKARGFWVASKSSSNYNFTPFSVAALLNMELLSLKKGQQDYGTVSYSYRIIRNSLVLKYLDASGYRFYNCSIFDFDGQPAHKYSAFLPYGVKLITANTLFTRIKDDFRQDILEGKWGLKKIQQKLAYENLHFNDIILDLTARIASEKSGKPKFVYTHLMMPHYPYYFDSRGNPLPLEKLAGLNRTNANDYIEYLQYSNRRILELTDKILAGSASPPIIILLSDHGFRHPEKETDPAYDFMNLNAVLFPDKNYDLLYDSITNVNMFRVILNQLFNQQLPLLKDSTTNLRN
jgi:hypothetical protein